MNGHKRSRLIIPDPNPKPRESVQHIKIKSVELIWIWYSREHIKGDGNGVNPKLVPTTNLQSLGDKHHSYHKVWKINIGFDGVVSPIAYYLHKRARYFFLYH